MRIETIKVKRAARDEDRGRWIAALADPAWQAGAKSLKQDGESWVRRATIDGRDVVIKCRPLDGWWARAKCALGYGRGDRHWRGAAWLAAKKISTAKPHLLAQARVDGRLCELLIMEALKGPTLLEVMDQVHRGGGPPVRVQHTIARAVAEQLGVIRRNGRFNRDHKPSNLILVRADSTSAEIGIIDCVGIRWGSLWFDTDDEDERMLSSLVIEPTGCGCAPRRALCFRVLREACPETRATRHASYRELINFVDSIMVAHGDPRPKTNPLSPPPRPRG